LRNFELGVTIVTMRPLPPPSEEELWARLTEDSERATDALIRIYSETEGPTIRGKYLHWDKLRQLSPPPRLTSEQWWFGIKMARRSLWREFGLTDPAGEPFVYGMPDAALEQLLRIDQSAAGNIAMPEAILEDESAKKHYLVNSLMEEAIRSSQLEGADTARRVAKEMLLAGRAPRDRSEQMILNNYRALEFMREEMGDNLTPELVLELHRILTEGTLEDASHAGKLQTAGDERVAVWDRIRGELVHRPPPAEQLVERMALMCGFANGEIQATGFLHPVVRAVLLHFWLAYDHPFEDGNGRTARALFYWSMRNQGYWLVEYLSISRILRQAPGKYGRAFLETESDDRDTTYFVLFHLHVIQRAIEELNSYLKRKVAEIRNFEASIRRAEQFNHRQLSLLKDAVRGSTRRYSFKSHSRSHDVTHQTARNDLLDLVSKGLLDRRRVGREHVFSPTPDLSRQLIENPN
jgi:Fic family protein